MEEYSRKAEFIKKENCPCCKAKLSIHAWFLGGWNVEITPWRQGCGEDVKDDWPHGSI